ncbi:helix-turn-helix domain-containing protein [Candidatus Methylomicrobium oryzae]|jgi:transposase|uniref:helix-turn-helix domain-containing protein n=1 Tax=Candidatus Methylomicrobium oryzae TaxID=2802053 RepID=UPI001924B6EB|nr:IS630 transposase-related protein [Methylomicrobium sp. RS1]MBL1264070.1 transposase [Methylomicrobium sp. RS1]
MPRAYSMDLRKRVIEACDEGQTIAQVAERFKVSASFVNQLRQRRRQRSTLEPKPHGGGRQPLLSLEHDEMLRTLLTAQPDTTLAELREKLGLKVHLSSLGYRLQRLGLTFKKNADSSRARARGGAPAARRLASSAADPGSSPTRVH